MMPTPNQIALWFSTQDFFSLFLSVMQDVTLFTELGNVHLRPYQHEVAKAITSSIIGKKGLTFVVIFPRQSGKNELQAQIEAYLLLLSCLTRAGMVKVSPTMKPQSLNAIRRLEHILKRNILTRPYWVKKSVMFIRLVMPVSNF